MKKTRALTVRRYAACLIDISEYLESFTGATLNDKIGATKLSEILLNSMPNSCSRQANLKVFDCESITFNKVVDIFELMEISNSIYKGVVEPSH